MRFFVAGEPKPKGSTKAFYIKKLERTVTTETNKGTKYWSSRVATEAQAQSAKDGTFFDRNCPLEVHLNFVLPRPKSAKKNAQAIKRPDLDKLIRAVLDGMTGVLYDDDSQVVRIVTEKRLADGSERHGVEVTIFYHALPQTPDQEVR